MINVLLINHYAFIIRKTLHILRFYRNVVTFNFNKFNS